MKQELTLGSLFSGSGGFELAASRYGFEPVWASEIEPLPMLVTKKNFPGMKHLGDINYIDGAKIDPVTVLSGGSPCQDMSIAGQRAGLDGSRSGLFREQIRIVKEMRQRDEADGRAGKLIRPRYMVWENVPGAFSSNGGEDFRAVLEEIANVTDENAVIPRPPKGRWESAGLIVGDNRRGGHYSIAWRVFDAQYWGVPQRRRRIYLVADFGGLTAPEILFVRPGLSGDFKTGRPEGEGTTGSVEDSTGDAGTDGIEAKGPVPLENHPADSRIKISEDGKVQTLTSRMGTGGMNVPLVMDDQAKALGVDLRHPCDIVRIYEEKEPTIASRDYKGGLNVLTQETVAPSISGTLTAKMAKGTGGPAGDECQNLVAVNYVIRRLTPLECCRLQGFPDDWTDDLAIENPSAATIKEWTIAWAEWWRTTGRAEGIRLPKDREQVKKWLEDPASDSALYKMWGNGIALPCAMYVFEGIAEVLRKENEGE